MSGNPVRPVLAAACAEPGVEEGWRFDDEPQPAPGGDGTPVAPWLGVRHARAAVPAQGWKLHVSASVDEALAVLARALPVLLAEPVWFKVAASVEALAILNAGAGGRAQAGKFITVYPTDDAQAVRLAVALDRATAGGRGPRVPSDRPLRPGSLVHYRYGAFVPRWVQTNLGEVAPAIESPDGTLVPDRRFQGYARPAWADDPFVAAGVVERHPPVNLFVAGRYLTAEVLSSTPELNVRLVVDTVEGARRVLKHARGRAGAMPGDGPIARLRHEASVLSLLAGDPAVPAVHDVFEDGDDLFVVLDHCEGTTFEQEMGLRSSSGRILATDQLRQWGCALADAVGRMHARGLVYGDLKSPHVIVGPEEHSVRLVDFESVWPNPDPQGAVVLGTPGYLSPQRAAMVEPSPADDVYGLGALLYFLATGAEPSHAPDRRRLLDRPVEALNPGVPTDLASLIARCLDPIIENRPSSMAEVARLLMSSPVTAPSLAPSAGRDPASVALDLARRLCRTAVVDGDSGTLTWRTDEADSMPVLRDVNAGAAGVVLALADAAPMLDDAEVWWALDRSARWLVASVALPGGPHPGLYVGESGIGVALLRAGQALGDPVLVAAAEAKGRLVAALPHASPDLFNGSAGRLRFHLMLWDATGDNQHLAAAQHAGDVLLATAGDQWPIPAGYESASGRVYIGYAHGGAGIADALLDLYEATGDERLAAAVAAAGAHLLKVAVTCLDDGSGLNWPGEHGGSPTAPVWCHGAAGVARFLLHAARLDAVQGAAPAAEAAARSAGRGARWVGPSQCHGLAGNADVLIDAFQVTGDHSFLSDAQHLGRLLEAYLVEPDDLYPPSPGAVRSADLMTGWAGLLASFVRLAAPTTSVHILSRR